MTPVTELKIASAKGGKSPEVRQRESRAVGASSNDRRKGRKPPERRKTQGFRAMSGAGGNWRKPAETPAEVRKRLPEMPEMPEIHSAAHPVGETANLRTGRSFGSTAAASRMRQAPPSSARRQKPAIGDGSAETAETASLDEVVQQYQAVRRSALDGVADNPNLPKLPKPPSARGACRLA
jgi:hypothetical protein